jgi:hypothetical protein
MSPFEYEKDQLARHNKWSVRVIKRGTDYDSAQVVKNMDFPDEVILAKAMWPTDAWNIVNEHNDAMAKTLFNQDISVT